MANNQSLPVTIQALPETLDAWLALRDQIAKDPQGGVVAYLCAGHLYGKDKKAGLDAFTVSLDRKNLSESPQGYKGFKPGPGFMNLVRNLDGMPWAAATYVAGTSPAGNYALPAPPYVFEVFANLHAKVSDTTWRLMVKTSGADNPRPFTVTVNDKGIWKVAEGSSLFTGMKKPASSAVKDDL